MQLPGQLVYRCRRLDFEFDGGAAIGMRDSKLSVQKDLMNSEFSDLLSRFEAQPVLGVGDVMLARYWMCEASRISPEAPVPVVRKQRTVCSPGGAGNVAANVAALGSKTTLVGVVGEDQPAAELRRALLENGVSPDCLLTDRSRM